MMNALFVVDPQDRLCCIAPNFGIRVSKHANQERNKAVWPKGAHLLNRTVARFRAFPAGTVKQGQPVVQTFLGIIHLDH